MPVYRNTQKSSYALGKIDNTTKPYSVGGAGATTPKGVRLDLVDIAEGHLTSPGIKKMIDQKILVPYNGEVTAPVAKPTPEAKVPEPQVPDLTAGVTGAPMVDKAAEADAAAKTAALEAKTVEASKSAKDARKANRRATGS
jgi:hypothetical protein